MAFLVLVIAKIMPICYLTKKINAKTQPFEPGIRIVWVI